jgi:hypothetical protein
MLLRKRCGRALPVLLLSLVSGCGGNFARVSGEVTYEGKPVEKGTISFLPVDGKGPSAGAAIVNGRYTATKVPPGTKMVAIESFQGVSYPIHSEDGAKASKSGGKSGGSPARLIPAKAEGNNSKVDLKVGDQQLDFHLKKGKAG